MERSEIIVAPRILFTPMAWGKLWLYVDTAPGEIGGLGFVDRLGDDFLVDDVFILEQDASAAHVDIDDEVMSRFLTEMVQAGRESDLARITMWWHSHGNVGAFFSSTDTNTISKWKATNYLLSVVVNKDRRYSARIDIFNPVRLSVPVEISTHFALPEDVVAKVKEEVRTLVKSKPIWPIKKKEDERLDHLVEQFKRKKSSRDKDTKAAVERRQKSDRETEPEEVECCSDMGCCGLKDYLSSTYWWEE